MRYVSVRLERAEAGSLEHFHSFAVGALASTLV